MNTYLVEYKMMWAGRVVREGIEQITGHNQYQAEKRVEDYLRLVNRKAEIQIVETVEV